MTLIQILNLTGLACITIGSILAAIASPSPKYGPDGSVTLAGEPNLEKRIAIHRWQKNFKNFLYLVALGAVLQAIATALPTGMP